MSGDNALGFLAANGLFCCNGNKDIFCSICATEARLDSWEEHIVDPTHVQTLEQFNQIFGRISTRSHCRLCGEEFDWRVLKNHARSHTILPWHKPYDEYDKYKIFFDNRIIEWKSLFHCCICNVTFSKFDVAFLHIANPTHQSRKEEIASLVYQFPTDAVSYDYLVAECLIASTETALECRICGSTKVIVDSVSRHVKGLMHRSNRSKFHLEFIERKAEEPVVEPTMSNDPSQSEESASTDSSSEELAVEDSSSEESTPEKAEAGALTADREIVPQSSACNYIVKHSSTDSYCIICNCVLFHHSTNNHMRDKDHVDALKAYGCDKILFTNSSEYYCTICNRTMTGPASVYTHIVGIKHLKSLNTSRQDRVQRRPNEVRPIKRPEEDPKKVSEPEGSFSAESREKGNSDKILPLEDNSYFCKCCNVTISGPENLYLHLKGKRHLHSCNLSQRQQARLRPDSFEALRRPNMNLGTGKDSLPSLPNTFGKQQIGRGSMEIPKRRDSNVLKTEERQLGLSGTLGKPQIQMEKSLESLKIPNVDSQTKEEHYSTWENAFGSQHVGINRDNFETPTRPEVVSHAKDERLANSPNEIGKRQAQRASPPVIPQRSEHLPERILESTTCDYLVRLNDVHLRCEVCDCTISRSSANINIHVTGNYHIASLKKYGCDYVTAKGDDIYYCECCDAAMVHLENVHLHIKNDRHIHFVAELNRQQVSKDEKSSKKVEMPDRIPEKSERLPESTFPTSPSIYVMKKNAAVSHCELCDVDLVGSSAISDHIAGADHAATMKEHGCDCVMLIDGDEYYCISCRCHICGCDNVYLHVKGRRHFFGLHHLPDRQQLRMAKKNLNILKTTEGPESNPALYSVTTEITKMMKKWRILEKKSRQN